MKIRCGALFLGTALILLLGLGCAVQLAAQTGTGTLRGTVTDPSGAGVPDASLQLITPSGETLTKTGNRDGTYEWTNLPAGKYTLQVVVRGFEAFKKEDVEIVAGRTAQTLDIPISIQAQQEEVTVSGEAPTVDVTPSNNSSSVVMTTKDLEALPDDPDDLQSALQALAGPSAGPNGGQMYIDGFTGGTLPPKSSIREIRINQNPFSSEYDRVGYGRIEILTRPGTDKFHGRLELNGNGSFLNSRNPFLATAVVPYHSTQFEGNVGGPLNKRSSFFVNAERRSVDDTSIINTIILDPSFNQVAFSDAIPNPQTRMNIGPRLDYQLGMNNTLTMRYQYVRNNTRNNGIGTNNLASTAFDSLTTEHSLQVGDTQIFGSAIVNETRFQFVSNSNSRTALSSLPTLNVQGAFTSGGNGQGNSITRLNRYELQNYTSIASFEKHFVKVGGRVRAVTDSNNSTGGFNGRFTFSGTCFDNDSNPATDCVSLSGLDVYSITLQGIANGKTPAQIRAAGGGANQFSLTTGSPLAETNMVDAGLYFQDDWRLRSNMTFSYGLRFETQNHINNRANWAPRVAFAWGIGGGKTPPKTVLRTGVGLFYDRFSEGNILQAVRQNGVTQQQFIVTNPDFYPVVPAAGTLPSCTTCVPTVYQISPDFHAPYLLQAAITVERQLTKTANLSVSYLNSRGYHQLLTNNINAPLTIGGPRPNGISENIYEYQSRGIFRQQQLITNINVRTGRRVSFNASYTLGSAHSDVAGGGFPSNPYNILADYGRAQFDVRHRVFFGGNISLPYAMQLSPFMVASSGGSYNITTGQDLNGDSIFNDRPSLVSTATCAAITTTGSIYCTPVGTFESKPAPGAVILPVNYGNGPGQFSLNLRLTKTFTFGKGARAQGNAGGDQGGGRPGGPGGPGPGGPGGFGGPRGPGGFGGGGNAAGRYSLQLGVNAMNLFNSVNAGTPVGNLTSKQFATSNSLGGFGGFGGPGGGGGGTSGANRRISLQLNFNF